MEQLKHECGVAMIRLKKPLEYYIEKYGTSKYALNKLYLLMEKQHNRGQEGAGAACVKLSAEAGEEFMFRERKEGKSAISDLFADIHEQIASEKDPSALPFMGECYMGHLRYSTTGRSGISYVHPVLRRQNYRHNTFALCGNFNLTNIDEIFELLKQTGQHPRRTSDTTVLLEQLGYELDREPLGGGSRLERILKRSAPMWDGGYVMCGLAGNGEMYALRDPWGVRSAFYYSDDEIVVVASERPVIQTVMNVTADQVTEINPGEAVVIMPNGDHTISQVVEPAKRITPCSFERIYFSRGSDVDIYQERKKLGEVLVPRLLKSIDNDLLNSVFSFIPNTAEIAFYGMHEGFNTYLDIQKQEQIMALESPIDPDKLASILNNYIRIEKVAIKDIKLRTFISESGERNELVNHVYDISYGTIVPEVDNLIAIDDSIVRGTTLRRSILTILSRLKPKKLVIVSSAPQIRYPDFYGIDMSNIGDLIAFRAAIELRGRETVDEIYAKCKAQVGTPSSEMVNYVQELYAPLSDEQVSDMITKLLTPEDVTCPVDIIFQTIDKLHEVCPNHLGDWYFSGNYPTPGGVKMVNQSFMEFYEEHYK